MYVTGSMQDSSVNKLKAHCFTNLFGTRYLTSNQRLGMLDQRKMVQEHNISQRFVCAL